MYATKLLAEWWGRGDGGDLMTAAVDALVGLGFADAALWVLADATLWVLDANGRACRSR